MHKTFDNIDSVYDDLLHKINFDLEDINHFYDISIEKFPKNNKVVVQLKGNRDIKFLNTAMKIPDYFVSIDLEKLSFQYGLSSRNNNTSRISPFNKKVFYPYSAPHVQLSHTDIDVNSNTKNIAFDYKNHEKYSPEAIKKAKCFIYKEEKIRSKVKRQENNKIKFIMHKLFSDYIDTDVRKIICYYKSDAEFFYYPENFFKSVLNVEYNEENYNLYIERLLQILKVYPALFRLNLAINYRSMLSDIFHGRSLKPYLGESFNVLKSIKTPIIKNFNHKEALLMHKKVISCRDLAIYRDFKNILHPDYLKSAGGFHLFKKDYMKYYKIDPKKKNFRKKIYNERSKNYDSIRFLREVGITTPLKLKKLIELTERHHEIAHRIHIPENEPSTKEEIFKIENSRRIDLSNFDYKNSALQLVTSEDFCKEGNELRHCVAGYHRTFLSKRAILFSINHDGNRSTAEYLLDNSKFKLIQHRSFRNSDPHPLNHRIAKKLEAFLNDKEKDFFKQIIKSPNYVSQGGMVLNEELIIEHILKPMKLLKKSNLG